MNHLKLGDNKKIPTNALMCSLQDQNEFDTGFTDIPKIISEEDVDILPYMGWTEEKLKTAQIIGAEDDEVSVTTKWFITAVM